jgi:hypothetical protein
MNDCSVLRRVLGLDKLDVLPKACKVRRRATEEGEAHGGGDDDDDEEEEEEG